MINNRFCPLPTCQRNKSIIDRCQGPDDSFPRLSCFVLQETGIKATGSFFLCFEVKLFNSTVNIKDCFSPFKETAQFSYMIWRESMNFNACIYMAIFFIQKRLSSLLNPFATLNTEAKEKLSLVYY